MKFKTPKKIVVLIFLCLSFGAGFFINQKINEYILKNLYTFDSINLFKIAEVWSEIEGSFIFDDQIDKDKMAYAAIKGIISTLDDPYTSFYTPEEAKEFMQEIEGSFEGIGIQIAKKDEQVIVIAPIKNTPAEKIGILAGDIIQKINDEDISTEDLDSIVKKIKGEKGTFVTLTIKRGSVEKTFKIKRETIKVPTADLEFIDADAGGKIAILSIFQFIETTAKDVETEVNKILNTNNVKGIILDLRNNPGGILGETEKVASLFLKEEYPIAKECDKNYDCRYLVSSGPGKLRDFKIAILINKGTASAAEILTGALEANIEDLTIIGETSFGKGLVQKVMPLSNGSLLKITAEKWYTPREKLIHEIGIEPDIKIEITEEDLQNKKDPQLEKAIEIINNK
jgi:carboxyl-terminal processing protease